MPNVNLENRGKRCLITEEEKRDGKVGQSKQWKNQYVQVEHFQFLVDILTVNIASMPRITHVAWGACDNLRVFGIFCDQATRRWSRVTRRFLYALSLVMHRGQSPLAHPWISFKNRLISYNEMSWTRYTIGNLNILTELKEINLHPQVSLKTSR